MSRVVRRFFMHPYLTIGTRKSTLSNMDAKTDTSRLGSIKTAMTRDGIRFRTNRDGDGVWVLDAQRRKVAAVTMNHARFFVAGFSLMSCVGDVDTVADVLAGLRWIGCA